MHNHKRHKMANFSDMCMDDVTNYLILTGISVYVNCMVNFNIGRN